LESQCSQVKTAQLIICGTICGVSVGEIPKTSDMQLPIEWMGHADLHWRPWRLGAPPRFHKLVSSRPEAFIATLSPLTTEPGPRALLFS